MTSKNFLGLDVEETMDCVLRVSRIVKKDTPDVTDAWVKENVPGAHDVESFYALVRRNLTEQARGDYDRIKEESAAHALSQRLPEAEVPEEYCNYARSGLLQNVSAALSLQGLTEEEFLTAQGTTESQFMIQMGMRAPGDRAPRARLGRPCSALGPGGAGRRPCAHAVEDVSGQGGRGAQDVGDERAHLPAARDGLALEGARLPDGNGGHASKIAPGVNDGRASKVAGLRQRRPRKQGDPWR